MADIDHILSGEPTIEPSNGFTLEVMRAVTAAQAAPPPLAFPWLRLVIGVVACALIGGMGALDTRPPDVATWLPVWEQLAVAASPLGYAAAVLCVVYCSLQLHRVVVRWPDSVR